MTTKCAYCAKEYTRYGSYLNHMKEKHADESDIYEEIQRDNRDYFHECTRCGRMFSLVGNRNRHMKTCNKEGTYDQILQLLKKDQCSNIGLLKIIAICQDLVEQHGGKRDQNTIGKVCENTTNESASDCNDNEIDNESASDCNDNEIDNESASDCNDNENASKFFNEDIKLLEDGGTVLKSPHGTKMIIWVSKGMTTKIFNYTENISRYIEHMGVLGEPIGFIVNNRILWID